MQWRPIPQHSHNLRTFQLLYIFIFFNSLFLIVFILIFSYLLFFHLLIPSISSYIQFSHPVIHRFEPVIYNRHLHQWHKRLQTKGREMEKENDGDGEEEKEERDVFSKFSLILRALLKSRFHATFFSWRQYQSISLEKNSELIEKKGKWVLSKKCGEE